MENLKKEIWFQNTILIHCPLEKVIQSLNDLGEHYKIIVKAMPGMTSVELLDQGKDYVTIKTNEGIMKRTNISVTTSANHIIVAFDEEYQAGKSMTSISHFIEKFVKKADKTSLHLEISDLKAPGLLGFFYRNFGRKNIGNAFLKASKKVLES